MSDAQSAIIPEQVGTMAGLFRERVRRSLDAVAHRQYDVAWQAWVGSSCAPIAPSYERLAEVMAVAQRAGIARIAFVTDPPMP